MAEADEYPRFRLTKGDAEPMRKRLAQQEKRPVVREYLENKRLLAEFEFAGALPLPESKAEVSLSPDEWRDPVEDAPCPPRPKPTPLKWSVKRCTLPERRKRTATLPTPR